MYCGRERGLKMSGLRKLSLKPSAEDIREMSAVRDKWLHTTYFAGDGYDEAAIKEGVRWIYSMKKLPMPEIVVLDSPFACIIEKNRLRKSSGINVKQWLDLHTHALFNSIWSLVEQELTNSLKAPLCTNNDSDVFVLRLIGLLEKFSEFCATSKIKAISETLFSGLETPGVMGVKYSFSEENLLMLTDQMIIFGYLIDKKYASDERFNRIAEFLKAGCFLSVFSHEYALISRRPVSTVLNNRFDLHCDGGPAIAWRDGTRLYYLNGVSVPEAIAITPAKSLDPKLLLKTVNSEVRKEIVRKIGIERIIKKLKCSTIDTWNGYELFSFHIPDMREPLVYLKMINPSTGVIHFESVPPGADTCKKALSWRVGGLAWNPQQLT